MFANTDDVPRFRVEEPPPPSRTGGVERLLFLLALAAILLVATIAVRSWTSANDAKLPPYEYTKDTRRASDSTAQPVERDHLTYPLPPRL